MAKFSYDDDEPAMEKARLSAQPTQAPTFAQLQQRGMPRPPPMGGGGPAMSLGSLYDDTVQRGEERHVNPPDNSSYSIMNRIRGTQRPAARPFQPSGARPSAPAGPGYLPTNELNQGNLEGYLYDMLANPTNTPTYKTAMRRIGADIDVDASRRGVFHSTIPVGAYSEAGAGLAAQLSQQAFGNLRGYNQDYEQLLMQLLGAS